MRYHLFFYKIIDMEYVRIGKIINTHGIKGELKINNYSDFVKERYKKGSSVYVGEDKKEFIIENYHFHKGFLLVSFKDNLDINLVEKLKNEDIFKAKKDIKPLKNGEYYFSDLIGLEVYVENEYKGKVTEVFEGIRNNSLRVKKADNTETLVPFLKNFIENVDLEKQRIDVIKMEGLL